MSVDILVLYYNGDLLKQYGKEVPKTWNELIETAKYITEQEKNNGRTLTAYNPFLDGKFYKNK